MANIIVQGKQYNNVPAVNFPKVGGGTATYTENGGSSIAVVQLTANANGTYNAPSDTAYNPVVVSIMPTLQSKTVNPTTSQQTVSPDSGYDGLSSVTVDPIPSQYIVPTGTVSITSNGTVDVTQYSSANVNVPAISASYLGTNPVKIADYATQTVALSNTNFATWTPSTTATDIYASSNAGTAVLDTSNYDYEIIWFFDIGFVYDGTESGARIRRQCLSIRQSIYKSPNKLTDLSNKNYNYNRCATLFTVGLVDYYNSSNSLALSYTSSVGIVPSAISCTYSSNTSNTPTATIKTPKIRAVCHNTYLTTTNCAKIDKVNTKFTLRGELWRVDKDSVMQGMYRNIVELYNS